MAKKKTKISEINLADLRNGMPGLTSALGQVYAEAASICLEMKSHQCGVVLDVNGHRSVKFKLFWEAITDQARKSYDPKEATEYGACGIAALICEPLTGMQLVNRSFINSGFDYWLGKPGGSDDLFQGQTRLEVSGTMLPQKSAVKARVKTKEIQTDQSKGTGFPAMIIVVAFTPPEAKVSER